MTLSKVGIGGVGAVLQKKVSPQAVLGRRKAVFGRRKGPTTLMGLRVAESTLVAESSSAARFQRAASVADSAPQPE